jgi:hypothetical protein
MLLLWEKINHLGKISKKYPKIGRFISFQWHIFMTIGNNPFDKNFKGNYEGILKDKHIS